MGTRRKLSTTDGKPRHFIREWLKHRDIKQDQLAAEAGFSTSSVNQLINGKQGYSQAALEALAPVLRCEPWELIAINPSASGRDVDTDRAARALRSALLAYGVDHTQIGLAIDIIGRFVASEPAEERSEQTQTDGQPQPAIRRRAVTP
ncbi:helix-turn-helix domain-containing protein [Rhizobium sp. YIM 134829]|uniref:helix-turn-helix domain-containing protein n=1 Tax=Rhizobium sp. YIM 134829 TaxID=3390453 RepID=UPI00397CA213